MEKSDAPQFRVGDRVFDRASIDDPSETPSLGIIVEDTGERAIQRNLADPETGEEVAIHEYGVNPAYSVKDDRIYGVVFTRWLDQHVPDWQSTADDPDALSEHLRSMAAEYAIPVESNTFDYPEGRLELRYRP